MKDADRNRGDIGGGLDTTVDEGANRCSLAPGTHVVVVNRVAYDSSRLQVTTVLTVQQKAYHTVVVLA